MAKGSHILLRVSYASLRLVGYNLILIIAHSKLIVRAEAEKYLGSGLPIATESNDSHTSFEIIRWWLKDTRIIKYAIKYQLILSCRLDFSILGGQTSLSHTFALLGQAGVCKTNQGTA
jgi:hypothetical protein